MTIQFPQQMTESVCSKTCGIGLQSQTRTCENQDPPTEERECLFQNLWNRVCWIKSVYKMNGNLQKTCINCIQDPEGYSLYTQNGTIMKGGINLPHTGVLENQHVWSVLYLSEAIHILLGDVIHRSVLKRAEKVQNAVVRYVKYVKLWGPLWGWNCFPFEDANATVLLKQIMKQVQVKALQYAETNINMTKPAIKVTRKTTRTESIQLYHLLEVETFMDCTSN